ncbi:hypothetical protein V8C26DRAFT_308328 [Trichoderma gracile]
MTPGCIKQTISLQFQQEERKHEYLEGKGSWGKASTGHYYSGLSFSYLSGRGMWIFWELWSLGDWGEKDLPLHGQRHHGQNCDLWIVVLIDITRYLVFLVIFPYFSCFPLVDLIVVFPGAGIWMMDIGYSILRNTLVL